MNQSPPRVAFQGVFGAFSHEACLACLPGTEPVPYERFDQAFDAVASDACQFAFIPVENSTAGPVPEVAELLPKSGLSVVEEHLWPIHLQLMALPGVTLAQLERVASHPMALKQCGRFLAAHGLQAEEAFDTAGAAKQLAASDDRRRAVVAARAAGELYGLEVVRQDVEDAPDNTTRFLVLSRRG